MNTQRQIPQEYQGGWQIQLHQCRLWDNEEIYWKAYEKSVTPMKAKLGQLGVEMTPALYQVGKEY